MPAARAYMTPQKPLQVGPLTSQADGIAWLKRAVRAHGTASEAEVARAVELYDGQLRAGHVASRASCLPDYTHDQTERMVLFDARDDGGARFSPPLQRRMAVFGVEARRLARDAFAGESEAPNVAVQVSCTGYESPHALQATICERGWSRTRFWHIGHMGCYAAIPALAAGCGLVADDARAAGSPQKGSILFIELCTLHCAPQNLRDDQVIMNTLFADGAVRVDVGSHPEGATFGVLGTTEVLIPDTAPEMTWILSESNFQMFLARSVPERIRHGIASFVSTFLRGFGLDIARVAHFALHPGGPLIIDMVASRLEIPEYAVRHSRTVLATRGNMSSATLPHIWHLMKEDPAVRPGDLVLSLAFGPGLTVAANLLQRLA
jgi:predicted naringenin-chalcone synthase